VCFVCFGVVVGGGCVCGSVWVWVVVSALVGCCGWGGGTVGVGVWGVVALRWWVCRWGGDTGVVGVVGGVVTLCGGECVGGGGDTVRW